MKLGLHQRIHLPQPCGRALEFGFPDPRLAVEDLALEIRGIHHIRIDQAEAADPGGGKIERGRRSQRAGADEQDGRVFQLQLSARPDGGDEDVAGITEQFRR